MKGARRIGAEAGIVLGGIAERLARSCDSSATPSRIVNARLSLFVSLCSSSPRFAVPINTLITPQASAPDSEAATSFVNKALFIGRNLGTIDL